MSHSAMAAVIDHADTEDKAGAIVLTDNSTRLQLTTGTATRSGVISGAFNIQKIGVGTLTTTAFFVSNRNINLTPLKAIVPGWQPATELIIFRGKQ